MATFTLWGLLLCLTGCQLGPGMFALARLHVSPPEEGMEEANPETDQTSVEEVSSTFPHSDYHWVSQEIWPEPTEGPRAVQELKNSPRFRWTLQATQVDHLKKTEKFIEIDTKSAPDQDQLADWWDQALKPTQTGSISCILLARHAPESLDELRLNRLESLALKGGWEKPKLNPENPVAEESDSRPDIQLNDQLAALEAWCYCLWRRPGNPEDKYRQAGELLQQVDLPDEVRRELWTGLARSLSPSLFPNFGQCFDQQTDPTVTSEDQQAAIDACLLYAITHPDLNNTNAEWPEQIWQLRWSNHPGVAIRFGLWLATTNHSLAESFLQEQLHHLDPQVKYAALRSLGLLDSETASKTLRSVLDQGGGQSRVVALRALGDRDADLIYRYAHEGDRQIREAVAAFAGKNPGGRSEIALSRLILDSVPQVQLAAVSAISEWDNEQAFSLLARGFHQGMLQTRQRCREELENRFHQTLAQIEETPEARLAILRQLAESNGLSVLSGATEMVASDERSTPLADLESLRAEIRELTQELLKPELTTDRLDEIRLRLEQIAGETPQPLHQEWDRFSDTDLLRISGQLELSTTLDIALFADLDSDSLSKRRLAASRLEQLGQKKSLPDWSVRLAGRRLQREQDPQIARILMRAIENETSPAARSVAQIALAHTWADVRVLGCLYAQKHRLPQLAVSLLPLLHDRNPAVQLAAINAAGACRNPILLYGLPHGTPEQQSGLRSLLGVVNRERERSVLIAMAQLQDEQARTELIKLTYNSSRQDVLEIIQAISELEDASFAPALIRRGWTESDPQVLRSILETLERIVPRENQPELSAAQFDRDRMAIWVRWSEKSAPLSQSQ
ncbi:MAG: hypothetical protein KDA78_11875 [Planctomycetaceae bacterium]|nr:hypothetical protein [Planctomycetaceae bacterium]